MSEITERLNELESALSCDEWDHRHQNVCRDAAAIVTSLRRELDAMRAENAKLREELAEIRHAHRTMTAECQRLADERWQLRKRVAEFTNHTTPYAVTEKQEATG